MAKKQDSLIYIEKENISEAEFMSRALINTETKKRAYINALGAELAIKYLESEGIDAKKSHNLHSISKIIEKYDIADIMLPNIHIDTRVVFDENQIFIPKSHFDKNLTPDIYFVLKLSPDFKYAQILGFIKPEEINKNNSNKDYYFAQKDELTSPDELKSFINSFAGNTSKGIDDAELLKARELYVEMADHNIGADDEQNLIKLLLLSDELRESILEFDNFETLSYSVGHTVSERLTEDETSELAVGFADDNSLEQDFTSDEQQEEIIEEEENSELDEIAEDEISELTEETLSEESAESELEEQIDEAEELLNEPVQSAEDENNELVDEEQELMEIPDMVLDTEELSTEELSTEELNIEELDTVSKEQEPKQELEQEPEQEPEAPKAQDFSEDNTAEDIIEGTVAGAVAGAAAGAVAGAAAAAGVSASSAVSDEAIKLASVSGELVNELVNKELEDQQEHLDRIDYAKTKTNATEIPEHIAAYDLSDAKEKADKEAEKAGFVEKTNLEDLKTREIPETIGYGDDIEQETVDLSQMDVVETEKFTEHTDALENLENLTSIDSPTKPVDNLEEKLLTEDLPQDSLDFSNMSSFDINEDGTSSIDNINIDFNPQKEEELVDIGIGTNDIVINTEESDQDYLNNNLDFNSSKEINLDLTNENTEPEENSSADITTDEQQEEALQEFPQAQENQDYTVEELSLDDLSIFEDNENPEQTQQEINSDSEFDEIAEASAEDNVQEQNDIIIDEPAQEEQQEPLAQEDLPIIEEQEVVQEVQTAEENMQDWMEDTNYDDLADAQIPQSQKTESEPEIIDEAQEIISEELPEEPVSQVEENSTVISDKTHTVGEISIDINAPINSDLPENEQIQNLYKPNKNVPGEAFLNSSGKIGTNIHNKRGIGGVLGVILTLLVVGGIGFGVSKMLKQPTEETPQPITDEALPTASDNGVTEGDTLNLNPDDVVNMEDNKPITPALQKENTSQTAQKAKAPAKSTQKSIGATAFIEVTKLSWEVPDYISYNPQFKQYFQSTGRRLKLALSSDLLLATDAVHTNQARVSILFDKDGTFKVAKILLSSGSTQIDNIVLQTVNQTLKTLKAPHSIGSDESTTVILKIYF